jgi:hypothetical protein
MMNSTKKIACQLSGLAIAASVVGSTLGSGGAAAFSGQTDGATLYVCPDLRNPTNVRLTVKGVFPMQQADAVGFMTHLNDGNHPAGPGPGGMIYHVEGDDGGGGLMGRSIYSTTTVPANTEAGYLRAGPGGLEYLKEILIRRSMLDEDGGGDEDEVFAWVTFRDGDGGSRVQSTQEIKHHFEQPGTGEPCFT